MSKNIEDTKNYYNGIAKGYKNLYHEEQIIKINKINKHLLKKGKLLDLGAGDGVLNQFLQTQINKKELILVSADLSEELLSLNSNKKENKFQIDAQELPFENEEFEQICAFTVYQDIPDKLKALNETYRVLKKNGTLIISFLHMAKNIEPLIQELETKFTIIEKIKEEKDFIYVLKK